MVVVVPCPMAVETRGEGWSRGDGLSDFVDGGDRAVEYHDERKDLPLFLLQFRQLGRHGVQRNLNRPWAMPIPPRSTERCADDDEDEQRAQRREPGMAARPRSQRLRAHS